MKTKLWLSIVIGLFLTGCTMPETRIQSSDSRPKLAVQGAPESSVLFVDGLEIGPANEYNGKPGILTIEPGTHEIMVRSSEGATLHQQTIFVESEIKTIVLTGLDN